VTDVTRGLVPALVLFLLAAVSVAAEEPTTGFLDRALQFDGRVCKYQVYVPRLYAETDDPLPVILFLHGRGERGADGILPTEIGIGTALRRHPERYPAIVVFPQSPDIWQGGDTRIALEALDQTLAEFRTDSENVILAGMSMGGNGAWYLAYHDPERFAKLVVVCGFTHDFRDGLYPAIVEGDGRYERIAERVKELPIWIAHGGADDVVPVAESRNMAKALEAIGADVTYTVYPGVGHGAWEPAFQGEALPAWLFGVEGVPK
jgi:predicted peptidase